ncbi:lytic transglycosylase domain-containing protein [Aridibaculum aurantiacum]|uniref:lytic transglycosylase domain-containing protein n=1 Tax=Aridibaculum aurantiacum TaxID=2810307 RepID=UPI001A967845|nr:lytic transglycosylase domain-containing protein [Aridibaculum aurantiacum]
MLFMKNVNLLVKLRRLVKSIAVSLIIVTLGIVTIAFKSATNDTDNKNPKESGQTKDGFKSLFSASTFDPAKPYISQLNPKAVPFVQDYIQKRGTALEKMRVWGKPYFDMYDGILSKYDVPKELKYLSVIESQLQPNVVSVAGAVGPWQIMASEARRMGLKVGGKVDERTNFLKSTHAAAKILKELYGQFNDWILVVAAYNCGAGRMRQAIRKSGSTNFWELQAYLPLETRNHVKKFIGTHYVLEGNGGLTTMTAAELKAVKPVAALQPVEDANTSIVEISGKYNSLVVAKQLGMEVTEFNKMNPQFDKVLSMGNSYNLRLPKEKVNMFSSKKNNILNESVQFMINSSNAFSAGQ